MQTLRKCLHNIWFLAPLIVTAIACAYFWYQWRNDEGARYYPYQWRAQWIAPSGPRVKTAYYRKELWLAGHIRQGYLAVCADNAYEVRINGKPASAFFTNAQNVNSSPLDLVRSSEGQSEPTNYSAIGDPNRGGLAHLYNIAPMLVPGKNVIACFVQSDRGAPRIACQGVIQTANRIEIASDSSWRCIPHESDTAQFNWDSRYLDHTQWPFAVAAPAPLPSLIDGDIRPLADPLRGYFVGAPSSALGETVHLRKMLHLNGPISGGYLRVTCGIPFSVLINGYVIGGTSLTGRYQHSLLLKQKDRYELFARTRQESPEQHLQTSTDNAPMNVYILKNVGHAGDNTLDIVLHQSVMPLRSDVSSVHLDGVFDFQNAPSLPVQTDAAWSAASADTGGAWTSALVHGSPDYPNLPFNSAVFRYYITPFSGTYKRVAMGSLLFGLGLTCLGLATVMLLRKARVFADVSLAQALNALFLTPAAVLLALLIMQAVFDFSPEDQWLSTQRFGKLALAAGALSFVLVIGVIMVAWLFSAKRRKQPRYESAESVILPFRQRGQGLQGSLKPHHILLGLMMIGSAIFCLVGLGRNSLIPDEYVSILAAQGVLHTGFPMFLKTHVIYTRSSMFHYLLAGWMLLWGGEATPWSTRTLAVFWHLILIGVTYRFGAVLKSRATGLLAAFLIAFSPLEICLAREARFYTEFELFSTLSLYFLLRSINQPGNNRYRMGAIVSFILAYLSQELALALIPAIVLVVALSSQARYWLSRPAVYGVVAAGAVMALDFLAYSHFCKTPLPFMDEDSSALAGLHSDRMELLASMVLVNIERIHLVICVFFVAGFLYTIYSLYQRNSSQETMPCGFTWNGYVYLTTGVTLVTTTVIAAHAASRYGLSIMPLCFIGASGIVLGVYEYIRRSFAHTLHSKRVASIAGAAYLCIVLTMMTAAFRPVRMWQALGYTLNRDDFDAVQYLRAHMQTGDQVISFNPEIYMVEMGDIQGDWRPWKESREKYIARDGRLRERNSGALVIDSADKLRDMMRDHNRVWVVVPPKVTSIQHANTARDLKVFLADNYEVVYQQYNIQIWEWDRGWNRYHNSVHDYGLNELD